MKRKILILTILLGAWGIQNLVAQTWSAVPNPYIGGRTDLKVYNNKLYIGGWYDTTYSFCPYLVAWNGSSWDSTGIISCGNNPYIITFEVYNGALYGAGQLSTAGGVSADDIFKWNGTLFSQPGSGLNGLVYDLTVHNSELYAGGTFTVNGIRGIARYNGTIWNQVGTGIDAWGGVEVIGEYNGELYAGGWFSHAGSGSANNIAKWNGTSWHALGNGLTGGDHTPRAFAVYNNELYVGGTFDSAGGISVHNIAKWNDTTWSIVGNGFNNGVRVLKVFNGELYAGGDFDSTGNSPINHIAKWDGSSWISVGVGMPDTTSNAGVFGMEIYNGELYVCGSFDTVGYVHANNIAKLSSSTNTNTLNTKEEILLYPNPVSTLLNIHHSTSTSPETLLITDLLGTVVYKENLTGIDNTISISTWSAGIYFYEVRGQEGSMRGKFVIQK